MRFVFPFIFPVAMPNAASDAAAKAAAKPRATGVKEVDAAFQRIRDARKVARDELKSLRKQYKKDTH